MNLVKPSVEYWSELNIAPCDHVARCAALCYKSENYNSEKMIERLIRDNHISMFRHQSHYYIVSKNSTAGKQILDYLHYCEIFGVTPFVAIEVGHSKIYVSTNEQYVMEHEGFNNLMKQYEVSIEDFAVHKKHRNIIRYTFCITTSIKVSRELNRVSPNNIAEQSTRFVNMFKKNGDVTFCESYDDHLTAADKAVFAEEFNKIGEWYNSHIASGLKPEDARRILALDTATRCAYTYTFNEWNHILDLRYFEKTGPAAPDAKIVATMIYNIFKELGYYE